MDLKKSFKIALAMRGKKQKELASEMKVTESYISSLCNNGSISVKKIDEMSERLGFKLWEFIKLGEE